MSLLFGGICIVVTMIRFSKLNHFSIKLWRDKILLRIYSTSCRDIHNWPLEPFSQDYNLASHTYSLKSVSNGRVLRDFSWTFHFIFTFGGFFRNLLRASRERNIFIFSFWYLTWGLNRGLSSNKPIHYPLDYGDFRIALSSLLVRNDEKLRLITEKIFLERGKDMK